MTDASLRQAPTPCRISIIMGKTSARPAGASNPSSPTKCASMLVVTASRSRDRTGLDLSRGQGAAHRGGTAVLFWYLASERTPPTLALRALRLERRMFGEILRVGAPMPQQRYARLGTNR